MHAGDIGSTITVNLGQDVSNATNIEFRFDPPRGDTFTRTGVMVNTGSDGLVKYVTINGDIPVAGLWRLQVKYTAPDGLWCSGLMEFQVEKNIVVTP